MKPFPTNGRRGWRISTFFGNSGAVVGTMIAALHLAGCAKQVPEVVVDEIREIPELQMAAYGMGKIAEQPGGSPAQKELMAYRTAGMVATRNMGELADLGASSFKLADGILERSRSFVSTAANRRAAGAGGDEAWSLATAPAPGEWFYHAYLTRLVETEQRLRAGQTADPLAVMALRGPGNGLMEGAADELLTETARSLKDMTTRRRAGKEELVTMAARLALDADSLGKR